MLTIHIIILKQEPKRATLMVAINKLGCPCSFLFLNMVNAITKLHRIDIIAIRTMVARIAMSYLNSLKVSAYSWAALGIKVFKSQYLEL